MQHGAWDRAQWAQAAGLRAGWKELCSPQSLSDGCISLLAITNDSQPGAVKTQKFILLWERNEKPGVNRGSEGEWAPCSQVLMWPAALGAP